MPRINARHRAISLVMALCALLLAMNLSAVSQPTRARFNATGDEQPAHLEAAMRRVLGPNVRLSTPGDPKQQQKLTGGDVAFVNDFGTALAMNADTAVVGAGAQNNGQGAAYVFTRSHPGTGPWIFQQKLIPGDWPNSHNFGRSVALSGDTILIGAVSVNFASPPTPQPPGAVYVFTRNGNLWTEQQKIIPDDSAEDDYFGYAVAVSGDTALVGAPHVDNGQGTAYLFTRNGSRWAQAQKLVSSGPTQDAAFGFAVALSADTAVVGEPDGATASGAAYIFTHNPVGNTVGWTLLQKLTASGGSIYGGYGVALALDGDTLIIGAFAEHFSRGAAYVYTRTMIGGTPHWGDEQEIGSPNSEIRQFGGSVALSGDTAVISAPNVLGLESGAAFVFRRTSSTWTEQQAALLTSPYLGRGVGITVAVSGDSALVGSLDGVVRCFDRSEPIWTKQPDLTAANPFPGDRFAASVAYSGDTMLVGVPSQDNGRGAVYLFNRQRGEWTNAQKLIANDSVIGDQFGSSVTLQGDYALVGAPSSNGGKGAVYVFRLQEFGWAQQQKLALEDGATGDHFGEAVALEGVTGLIGASGRHGQGAAYVFSETLTGWKLEAEFVTSNGMSGDRFGAAVALNNRTALVGAPDTDGGQGAVYVFSYTERQWPLQATLGASDGAVNDRFGASVAIFGDEVLIGAVGRSNGKGAAYLFARNGAIWSEGGILTDPAADDGEAFGYSVALVGTTALVGAPGASNAKGAAFLFFRLSTGWVDGSALVADDAADHDRFGAAIAISNSNLLVGAPDKDEARGAAYTFVGVVSPATPTPYPTATPTPTASPTPIPRPDTIGVYKDGVWYLRNSNTTGDADIVAVFGGDPSDLPVTGDWDGDGVDTIGVYRQRSGRFYLSNSNIAPSVAYDFVFGNPGDIPFSGHWNSYTNTDGVGVYRPSNGMQYEKVYLTSGVSDYYALFGNPGDLTVTGGWLANGFDALGLYRPGDAHWYYTVNSAPLSLIYSNNDFVWDIGSGLPVIGDWDGDHLTTVGYLTATGNFVLHATNATIGADTVFPFGPVGARPVAGKWVAASRSPNRSVIIGGRQSGSSTPAPSGFE